MSVRIITDSASDMSPAEHPALRVLPLSVTFGTDVYMDGVDIDHQRFYEMLVERDELPKTGQVNPYAFSQAIAEAREAGLLPWEPSSRAPTRVLVRHLPRRRAATCSSWTAIT